MESSMETRLILTKAEASRVVTLSATQGWFCANNARQSFAEDPLELFHGCTLSHQPPHSQQESLISDVCLLDQGVSLQALKPTCFGTRLAVGSDPPSHCP